MIFNAGVNIIWTGVENHKFCINVCVLLLFVFSFGASNKFCDYYRGVVVIVAIFAILTNFIYSYFKRFLKIQVARCSHYRTRDPLK